MANIRIKDLPSDTAPSQTDTVPIDLGTTRHTTVEELVLAGRPTATKTEAEAGIDPKKAMTPLTTKQAIDAQVAPNFVPQATRVNSGIGLTGGAELTGNVTLSLNASSIASLAKADSAVQPSRTLTAGTGLSGLGNLAADRTISLNQSSIDSLSRADSAIQAPGGTTGQVLFKESNLENHVSWRSIAAATAVSYTPQVLSESEKIQARTNIEADKSYDSIADVQSSNIASTTDAINVLGYNNPGDYESALYKRVTSEPDHNKKIQSADGSWWELASFKQPSTAAIPRTYTDRLRDAVSVFDFYRPTDNGISHAVNRAIAYVDSKRDGSADVPKGSVIFPNLGGIYEVSTPIVLKSYVDLIGIGNPPIKLTTGASGNVIESENFWTNKGTGGTSGDPGIRTMSLQGFTVDGNRINSPSGEYGVAVYGRDLKIADMRIANAKKSGLFTQWRGGNVDTLFPFTSWEMESEFSNIKIKNCGWAGFEHHGAHDSRAYGVVCMHNGMDFAEYVQALVSGGMTLLDALAASAGQTRYPAILIGAEGGGGYGFHLTDCHTWGRYNSYGVKVDVSGVSLSGNQFEGAYDAQVGVFAPRVRMSGNLMYCGSGNDYWQPNPVGIEIGSGVSTLLMDTSNAFSSVKSVVKKIGSSNGLNTVAGTIFSSDSSARVFDGSGSWSPSDRSDMSYEGGITIGSPKPSPKFEGNIRGAWSPNVTFQTPGTFSPSYAKQSGSWTRVGDRVFFSIEIEFNANSYTGASGTLRITLPFSKAGVTADSVDIGRFANLTLPSATNDLSPKGYITQGNSYFGIAQPVDGGGILFLSTASIPSGTNNIIIEASGHYTV